MTGNSDFVGTTAKKFRRLVALKDKYDPDNIFALNQNIPPSVTAT